MLSQQIVDPRGEENKQRQRRLWTASPSFLEVQAIFSTCLQHYPLEQLETRTVAEKDMRNAVDEVCRKTKIVTAAAAEIDNTY